MLTKSCQSTKEKLLHIIFNERRIHEDKTKFSDKKLLKTKEGTKETKEKNS